MKTFHGLSDGHTVMVDVDDGGRRGYIGSFPLPLRLDMRNHSPTGFSWGYAGSGPAQLALAICADLYDAITALRIYQTFKEDVIAALDGDKSWTLTEEYARGVCQRLIAYTPGPHDLSTEMPETEIEDSEDAADDRERVAQVLRRALRRDQRGHQLGGVGDDIETALRATERAQQLSGPSVMPEPTIDADAIAWEETGDEFPASRLLATIVIAGCRMHLEAYAVELRHHDAQEEIKNWGGPGRSASDAWDEQIFPGDFGDTADKVYDAIGADGPWQTVMIHDREYVLIATPFGS